MTNLLQGVQVLLKSGLHAKVFPEIIVGDYAIHGRLWGARPVDHGITVTHIPSGLAIWTVSHASDAVKVAQLLDRERLIQGDAFEWGRNLKGPDKVKFIERLSAIAPRFKPTEEQ